MQKDIRGVNNVREIIESIFGTYVPIFYETVDADGNILEIIPPGLAGVDWTYVLGVLGFFVVLYCVLRIVGSVISKC